MGDRANSFMARKSRWTMVPALCLDYPTADSNANLAKIPELAKRFPNRLIGYSDHTLPKNLRLLRLRHSWVQE